MNTWQQLVKEFQVLKARVDALEKQKFYTQTPEPKPQLPMAVVEPEPVRRGRPRKSLEGEDS